MKKFLLFLLMISSAAAFSQEANTPSGNLTLGMRSSFSAFSDAGFNGKGYGGQFRLRFAERVNSEWFADYLLTNIGGLGKRTDAHIGWSVMFYPFTPEGKKLVPYVLAGHCFDYTKVIRWGDGLTVGRWSSAVNTGIGTHIALSELFDASVGCLYMMHLGNDIETEVDKPSETLVIKREDLGLEGHLLLTVSLNVKVADLWK
jgi:hypothetical protein